MRLAPNEVGNFILQFCLYTIPCDDGDEAFQWITKDWGGGGTTCGFLCHAALWLAGVRGPLCNRTDPSTGKGYINGANISRIFNAGRPPFTLHPPSHHQIPPPPGSILFISNGPPLTEHVCIFSHVDGGDLWITYDGGQKNHAGKECMRARERKMQPGSILGGRRLVGYLKPENLPITADAIDIVNELSDQWPRREGRNPFTGKSY